MKKRIYKATSKKDMEDILHNEQLDAKWKAIEKNRGASRKAEEDKRYWKEVLGPFHAEMMPNTPAKSVSSVVDKEIEEYKENDPYFAEFDYLEAASILFFANISLMYIAFLLGLFVWMLLIPAEDTCLSC